MVGVDIDVCRDDNVGQNITQQRRGKEHHVNLWISQSSPRPTTWPMIVLATSLITSMYAIL